MSSYTFEQDPADNPYFYLIQAADFLPPLDDDSSHSTSEPSDSSSDSSHASKPGRHVLPDTQLLNSFMTTRNQRRLKKENLRICLYRGLLRCLKKKDASTGMTQRINRKFEDYDPLYYQSTLSNLYAYYDQYHGLIDQTLINPSEFGERSYSSRFFSSVFHNPILKECMRKYIEFVFFDTRPEVMEQRLCVRCCPANEHVMECSGKWQAMKELCADQLFSLE